MKVLLKPLEGKKIRKPDTKIHLLPEGEMIEKSPFWIRRIKEGDVVEVELENKAEKVTKKQGDK